MESFKQFARENFPHHSEHEKQLIACGVESWFYHKLTVVKVKRPLVRRLITAFKVLFNI